MRFSAESGVFDEIAGFVGAFAAALDGEGASGHPLIREIDVLCFPLRRSGTGSWRGICPARGTAAGSFA